MHRYMEYWENLNISIGSFYSLKTKAAIVAWNKFVAKNN